MLTGCIRDNIAETKVASIWLTCTLEELGPDFFGKPPSIPKSAKKLDDFGGDTWLRTWEPPVFKSDDWTFSTYSNRDVGDGPAGILFVEDGTGAGGSSGFCS